MVALLKMPNRIMAATGAERRVFPRKEIHVQVDGRRLDHSIHALQQPTLKLHLRDLSFGGLSAISDYPLGQGEHLSVIFPPREQQGGWDAYGRVIRCMPSSLGYQVAVQFDPLPAA
jgi:hypothetical protein